MLYEVFETNGKGRGLKALDVLHTGQTVLEESPVLCVLSSNRRRAFCDQCFKMKADLLRCSGCRFSRYCGQQCQRKAWKRHRHECKKIVAIAPRIVTDLVRLIYSFLQRKIANKDMSWYETLVSNADQITVERKAEFVSVVAVLACFAGQEFIARFNTYEVFELFAKISSNSFSICDGDMQPIGVGLYSMASMLNHSCSPNCVAVFNGTQLTVRALRKISSGEELTISYTELLAPSKVRQKSLKEQYFFDCHCPKCLNADEDDVLITAFKCVNESCKNPVSESGKCSKCGSTRDPKEIADICLKTEAALKEVKGMRLDNEKTLGICEDILKQQEGIMHPCHYLLLRTLDKAFDSCVWLSKWNRALYYGLRTIDPYTKLYHEYHPNVGIHLCRLGKIQTYLDKLETGVSMLQKGLEILEITHGGDHPTTQLLKEVLAEETEEYRQERMNLKR